MLKLGGYGLIRLSCFMGGNMRFLLINFSLIGGLLIRIICLSINDLKILVAYSSVRHMAFVIATALRFTSLGFKRSSFVILAHGISSSGIFLLAFMIYEVRGSRNIQFRKGSLIYFPMLFLP